MLALVKKKAETFSYLAQIKGIHLLIKGVYLTKKGNFFH